VRDYADVHSSGQVTAELARYAWTNLKWISWVWIQWIAKILSLIYPQICRGPVGIDTLSSALSEEADTLEEVYEPFLLQEGLIPKNLLVDES